MGTIAARDCLRILQLTEQVAAASLMASCQAVQIRINQQELDSESLSYTIQNTLSEVFAEFSVVDEDRPLEAELRQFVSHIQNQRWTTYSFGG